MMEFYLRRFFPMMRPHAAIAWPQTAMAPKVKYMEAAQAHGDIMAYKAH